VLTAPDTLFWTGSVNMGLRHALHAGATHLMTLNNDVLVPPTFIETMLSTSAAHPASLLGALEKDAHSQAPIWGGEVFDWRTHRAHHLLRTLAPTQQHGLHAVSYLPGRGLLIPRAIAEQIGLFDEDGFPHYYADYDFTHRALRAGYELYCHYDAPLYTYPDASGDQLTRQQRNLSGYLKHLFSIKGGGNLGNFTRYTRRHCPGPQQPYALLNGYARRMAGYFVH
jgi:GT2 family glycosyltransferase